MRKSTTIVLMLASLCCVAQVAGASMSATLYRLDRDLDSLTYVSGTSPDKWFASRGRTYAIVHRAVDTYDLKFEKCDCPTSPDIPAGSREVIDGDEGRVYRVARRVLARDPLYHELVHSLDIGAIVVPWKFRPDVPHAKARASGEATLGTGIGFRFATDHVGTLLEPVLYLGLTQIALNDSSESAPKQSNAGTLAVGLQLDVPTGFKLGLVAGWDRVFGDDGATWPFQKRPWFSFGINFAFFDPQAHDF